MHWKGIVTLRGGFLGTILVRHVVAISLFCAASTVHAVNPFMQTLAQTPGGVVIAYGTTDSSLLAANTIRDAIRTIPNKSTWNNLRPAAQFDADTFTVTGKTHIVAVGTLWDNVVLRGRNWLPSWWMDWTWYTTHFR